MTMNTLHFYRKAWIFGLIAGVWFFCVALQQSAMAQGELTVACDTLRCLDTTGDQTVDLLLRQDETVPVTLHWRSPVNPVPEKFQASLYAGNPAILDKLPMRGVLNFTQKGSHWVATYEVSGADLGRGTFLTIVVLHKASDKPQNISVDSNKNVLNWEEQTNDVNTLSDRKILDWRAFRLLTETEREHRRAIPKPTSEWSVHVQPALLRVTSGRGDLPRHRGGDRKAWWSLSDVDGNFTDLDIDGENSGVPGLGIQVATPWHTRADDQTWKDKIVNNLKSLDGHQVRFGELEWIERQDRTVDLGGKVSPIIIRHYYTVVSLYTNATSRSFTEEEVGGFSLFQNPRYFSHETSARLKVTDDPRFWASYSKRQYGSDAGLLDLLKEQVERESNVPGLTMIQTADGDGGDATYHAGFYAYVRPWKTTDENQGQSFRAGLIGIDIVAARAGVGRLVTAVSADQSDLSKAWCQVVACNDSGHELDLDNPPDGYRASTAVARLLTLSGNLPVITEKPVIVERNADMSEPGTPASETLPNLPDRARFGVSANLQAGAVMQKASWGHIQNIVPINTYAQFVIKLTVAMHPMTDLVVNNDVLIPSTIQFDSNINLPKPQGFFVWLKESIAKFTSLGIIIGVLALLLLIPGLRRLVSSLFSLLASTLDRIASGIKPKNEK